MASDYNFDHPGANRIQRAASYMLARTCATARRVELPVRLVSGTAAFRPKRRSSARNQNFEGLFNLYDERLRDFYDLKVFVDTDADVRISRKFAATLRSAASDLGERRNSWVRFVEAVVRGIVLRQGARRHPRAARRRRTRSPSRSSRSTLASTSGTTLRRGRRAIKARAAHLSLPRSHHSRTLRARARGGRRRRRGRARRARARRASSGTRGVDRAQHGGGRRPRSASS